jgi:hypothetical protein
MFLHNLQNVLAQITNKMGLQKKNFTIRRPGFDSRHYQKEKNVMGLERGALSLVSTTEVLLDRKVAAPV